MRDGCAIARDRGLVPAEGDQRHLAGHQVLAEQIGVGVAAGTGHQVVRAAREGDEAAVGRDAGQEGPAVCRLAERVRADQGRFGRQPGREPEVARPQGLDLHALEPGESDEVAADAVPIDRDQRVFVLDREAHEVGQRVAGREAPQQRAQIQLIDTLLEVLDGVGRAVDGREPEDVGADAAEKGIRARSAVELVVTRPADQSIDTLAALEPVIAALPAQFVGAVATPQDIVAGAPAQDVAGAIAGQPVGARSAIEEILAAAAEDHVVADLAEQPVVAAAPGNGVVARQSVDPIGSRSPLQHVVAGGRGDHRRKRRAFARNRGALRVEQRGLRSTMVLPPRQTGGQPPRPFPSPGSPGREVRSRDLPAGTIGLVESWSRRDAVRL